MEASLLISLESFDRLGIALTRLSTIVTVALLAVLESGFRSTAIVILPIR